MVGWAHRRRTIVVSIVAAGLIVSIEGTSRLSFDADRLMFVDFPSLEQLGRLLGHSMMVCGALTLIMVPALLPSVATRNAPPPSWRR
jgi:hypothetical protein